MIGPKWAFVTAAFIMSKYSKKTFFDGNKKLKNR